MRGVPAGSSVLPSLGTSAILVRLAAWPVLWLGAKAMSVGSTKSVAAGLVVLLLVFAEIAKRGRSRGVLRIGLFGGGAVVAFAVAWIARLGFLHFALASVEASLAGAAIGLGVGATYTKASVATRSTSKTPRSLDERIHATALAAPWFVVAAVTVRLSLEVVHSHAYLVTFAAALAVVAVLFALAALSTNVRLLAWTRGVYRGHGPLRVGVAPEDAPGEITRLADVAPCDAAIVGKTGLTPYRSHLDIVAMVPSSIGPLERRFGLQRSIAVGALLLAAGAVVAARAGVPAQVHVTTRDVATLIPSGLCKREAFKEILFVPVEAPRTFDVDDVASRIGRSVHRKATVAPPLSVRGVSRVGTQLVGEDVLAHAARLYPPAPGRIVIVVTEEDMLLSGKNWRYAFATRDESSAVVSVARMTPSFPWLTPASYLPKRPACSADFDARMTKMLTRQILFVGCGATPTDERGSLVRASVMSLDDLDEIGE